MTQVMTRRPASAAGGDATDPRPLHTTVITGPHGDEEASAVVRIWTRKDKEACRLCPLGGCTARKGPWGLDRRWRPTRIYVCTVAVLGAVPEALAPLLSLCGAD